MECEHKLHGGAFEYYFFILKIIIKQQKEAPCKLVLLL